jgi:hypothetical protein
MDIFSKFNLFEARDLCVGMIERAAWTAVADKPGAREAGPRSEVPLEQRRQRLSEWKELVEPAVHSAFADADRVISNLIHDPRHTPPAGLINDVVGVCDRLRQRNSTVTRVGLGSGRFQLTHADRWPVDGLVALRLSPEWDAELRKHPVYGSALEELSGPQRFIVAVGQLCAASRRSGATIMTAEELMAIERAFQLVERGAMPPPFFHPILTSIERPYQTYLSLADAGEWHLETTTAREDLLSGTIIHIEYIDRGPIDDKGVMEAYRIPSIRNAARLRVVVGDATPCTVYIGRPLFENRNFDLDLLKTAHTVAAACSAMFTLGIADCKIAMDGLSCRQAIRFMRGITGNVIRDSHSQRLSAAFNLNTPILDDRDQAHKPVTRSGGHEIAMLAIELVQRGGFNKVAWDGAGNGQSLSIIGQLSPAELLDLVHQAHRRGLETYISAGMDADEMISAVRIGVGGVGIGTRLHERENGTPAIGRLNQESVERVLKARDQEARKISGRAAACLAKLDWLYAEAAFKPELQPLCEPHSKISERLYSGLRAYLAAQGPADQAIHEQALERFVIEGERALEDLRDKVKQAMNLHSRGDLMTRGETPARNVFAGNPHPVLLKAAHIIAARQSKATPGESLPHSIKDLQEMVARADVAGVEAWLMG